MDVNSYYTIRAIDKNVDITKYADALEEELDSWFDENDGYLTVPEGEETVIDDLWDTAKTIAACIPDVDFVMEGEIGYYSSGERDFFIITVKDKTLYSKHTGASEIAFCDDYDRYDEFIEEFPQLEESFTEEDFNRFRGKEIIVGWTTAGTKDDLEYMDDEFDLETNEKAEEESNEDPLSRIIVTCDDEDSKSISTFFETIFSREWSVVIEKTKEYYPECNTDYYPLTCKITEQGFEAIFKPLAVPYGEFYCSPDWNAPDPDKALKTALKELKAEYPNACYKGHIYYYVKIVKMVDGEVTPDGGMMSDYDISSEN